MGQTPLAQNMPNRSQQYITKLYNCEGECLATATRALLAGPYPRAFLLINTLEQQEIGKILTIIRSKHLI